MSSDDEPQTCPMCTEVLDLTDLSFKPCKCGYQMCGFCWHRIKDSLKGSCPNCRRPYTEENYEFTPPDPEQIEIMKREQRQKERGKKKSENSKKHLNNIRVVQRNLVYVTNLALSVAKEEILRKPEFFGQYGKVQKIVVNRQTLYNNDSPNGPSVSAYVTYYKRPDAMKCILAVNGAWLENRPLRASFGTTKYCAYFLRNMPCTNPDCMYLHELGDQADSFTKEEMTQGKHLISFLPDLGPPASVPSGRLGLPPPRTDAEVEQAIAASSEKRDDSDSLNSSKELNKSGGLRNPAAPVRPKSGTTPRQAATKEDTPPAPPSVPKNPKPTQQTSAPTKPIATNNARPGKQVWATAASKSLSTTSSSPPQLNTSDWPSAQGAKLNGESNAKSVNEQIVIQPTQQQSVDDEKHKQKQDQSQHKQAMTQHDQSSASTKQTKSTKAEPPSRQKAINKRKEAPTKKGTREMVWLANPALDVVDSVLSDQSGMSDVAEPEISENNRRKSRFNFAHSSPTKQKSSDSKQAAVRAQLEDDIDDEEEDEEDEEEEEEEDVDSDSEYDKTSSHLLNDPAIVSASKGTPPPPPSHSAVGNEDWLKSFFSSSGNMAFGWGNPWSTAQPVNQPKQVVSSDAHRSAWGLSSNAPSSWSSISSEPAANGTEAPSSSSGPDAKAPPAKSDKQTRRQNNKQKQKQQQQKLQHQSRRVDVDSQLHNLEQEIDSTRKETEDLEAKLTQLQNRSKMILSEFQIH